MHVSGITWNLAGLAVPLVAALLCTPGLLDGLGLELFGLLSLIWAMTSLAGLFDLGVGRACTRWVAEHQARGGIDMRTPLAQARRISLLGGCIGGALFSLLALTDLSAWLNTREVSAGALRDAVLLLAPMLPLQALSATERGIAEGLQRFRVVGIVRMGMGSAMFVLPWLLLPLHPDPPLLTGALLLSRVAGWLALRASARLPALPPSPLPLPAQPVNWWRAGGWLTVSAVVSPLMVQADRFAIAAVLSTAAVGIYTLPFDLVTQLLIVPTALGTVAYPVLSAAIARDRSSARTWLARWAPRLAVLMGVLCFGLAQYLEPLMGYWLGNTLPPQSVTIGRWLCLGVWINAMGSLFYVHLHARGRYRDTAILHLIELPIYALLLLALLARYGVLGAAWAWVLRVGLDTLVLAVRSWQLLGNSPSHEAGGEGLTTTRQIQHQWKL